MEQTFKNPTVENKDIKISFSAEHVCFTFPAHGNREFYYFPKKMWFHSFGMWRNQLRTKNWFTREMEIFIDSAIILENVF